MQGDLYKANMLAAKTVEAPPLFSDQTEARTQAEKICLDAAPPPPPLSKGLDDRRLSPLSQGLDPTLEKYKESL